MGKAYSVNGYINATLRRSSKTLLVEGVTDKAAIHRLIAERFPASPGEVVIDHAGLLQDESIAGMGNKAKVCRIREAADSMSGAMPRLKTVFASLVDREWDGLTFEGTNLAAPWVPPTQVPPAFVTHGHSLESYHFDADCVIGYLKFAFAEHVNAQVSDAVRGRFESMLRLATLVSLHAKECSCLTRCGGLFNLQHVRYDGGHYCLTDDFVAACLEREIAEPEILLGRVNAAVLGTRDAYCGVEETKWIAHGHIGSEILWVCVADTVASFSGSSDVGERIACSSQKERMRFFSDWLSKADANKRKPLDETVEWLHQPQPA